MLCSRSNLRALFFQLAFVFEKLKPNILDNTFGNATILIGLDSSFFMFPILISGAIANSKRTIICFSHDYVQSMFKQYEALMVHFVDPDGQNKTFVPIVLEGKEGYVDCIAKLTKGPFKSIKKKAETKQF